MAQFDDIGFLLMDVAKMCNVDAARIVKGDAIAASLAAPDQSGFHVIGSEAFQAPDGTPARLLLLSMKRRRLTERERTVLRAMALHAQMQMQVALAPSQRDSASLSTGAATAGAAVPSASR